MFIKKNYLSQDARRKKEEKIHCMHPIFMSTVLRTLQILSLNDRNKETMR